MMTQEPTGRHSTHPHTRNAGRRARFLALTVLSSLLAVTTSGVAMAQHHDHSGGGHHDGGHHGDGHYGGGHHDGGHHGGGHHGGGHHGGGHHGGGWGGGYYGGPAYGRGFSGLSLSIGGFSGGNSFGYGSGYYGAPVYGGYGSSYYGGAYPYAGSYGNYYTPRRYQSPVTSYQVLPPAPGVISNSNTVRPLVSPLPSTQGSAYSGNGSLRPGMVLPDGAVVISVEPVR